MITSDFHVHTSYSSDSTASMQSMIDQAIVLGIRNLCITDHMDYDYPEQYRMPFTFDVDKYFKEIEECRMKYKNQITIFTGIELGLVPKINHRYEELVGNNPFDFVIGSSHLIENLDPYYEEFWQDKEEEEGYRSYFQTIIENMKVYNNFDAYGHIDYIVRYGPNKNQNYSYEKYADLLDQILHLLITKGKALEINSAGFKYGLGQAHPQLDVLKQYKKLGGELITIGSDAHKPEHLAYDFNKVEDILVSLGFRYYIIYEQRVPQFIKI